MSGIDDSDTSLETTLLNQTRDGLVVVDPGFAKIIDVNDTFCEISGYRRDDVLGKQIWTICEFEDESDWRSTVPESTGETRLEETLLHTPEDSNIPVELSFSWVSKDDREFVVTNVRDISERKRCKREREFQTSLLDAQMDATEEALIVVDRDRNIVSYNSRFLDLWGIPDSELDSESDTNAFEYVAENLADPVDFLERIENLFGTNEESQEKIQLENGRIMEQTSIPLIGENKTALGRVWAYRKVTTEAEYGKRINRARQRLRQIIDMVPDPVFVKNERGEFVLVNQAVAEVYDRPVDTIEGLAVSELPSLGGGNEGFQADDDEVVESGESKYIPEEKITTVEGDTLILETRKFPYEIAGDGGKAVLGYARDVTDLKEREQTLERQRNDLQILNQILRHDIRNDLQLATAYTEMLKEEVKCDKWQQISKIRKSAESAIDLTETVGDLTETLLTKGTETGHVALRPTLISTIENIRSKHSNAAVVVDGSIPDITIAANNMLSTVFRNVLSNAINHNDKEAPEVRVSLESKEDTVVVNIADNGPGVPDERKDEIFGKGDKGLDSEGTGIGLYLVNTLVTDYGGEVWVEDRVEDDGSTVEGSIFKLEFPRQ